MYSVFEDGKPATNANFPVEARFYRNKFKTFEEALSYAKEWAGRIADGWDGKKPLMFWGSKIEIRKVRK
jgi:hypothetical protein